MDFTHASPSKSLQGAAASYTVEEILALQRDIETFAAVANWTRNYLARPHADLGRSGPVCPFAPAALQRRTMRISVVHFKTSDHVKEVEAAVLNARIEFLGARTGSRDDDFLRAIIVAFPDVLLEDAPSVIDFTKERLKSRFVADGLMLGEFHMLNETGGLHNAAFRPLRGPVPMLAIRSIVSTDLVFLDRPEYSPQTRIEFLRAFLSADAQLSDADRTKAETALAAALAVAESTYPSVHASGD